MDLELSVLTFVLFGGSCKQSVEDVVVSFTRVLTYHSILWEDPCSNTLINILKMCFLKKPDNAPKVFKLRIVYLLQQI